MRVELLGVPFFLFAEDVWEESFGWDGKGRFAFFEGSVTGIVPLSFQPSSMGVTSGGDGDGEGENDISRES